MANPERFMARWDDFTPASPLWHPSHRRHRRSRNTPWTEISLFDDTVPDVGKSFEQAMDVLHISPPIGSTEVTRQQQKSPEKRKTYKKKIPLVVRGVLTPEDIKVVLKNNILEIEARKEQKSQDGSSSFYQEYHKTVTLPENVQTQEVRTILTHDGHLKIEAPLETKPETPTEIPIQLSF